ncbi:MAG: hypothetical protein ACK5V3_11905 [Bdellovibrionales bacterium]
MDFNRTQRLPIVLQKGSLPKRTFFIYVKLILSGPIDPESGMILNLKLVDQAFHKLRSETRVYKSFVEAAFHLSQFFKGEFKFLYKGLEFALRKNKLIIEESELLGQITTEVEIREANNFVLRSLQLTFKDLSFGEARKWVRSQNKKSRDEVLTAFLSNSSQLHGLKIEFPEWQGWECYSLHGLSGN